MNPNLHYCTEFNFPDDHKDWGNKRALDLLVGELDVPSFLNKGDKVTLSRSVYSGNMNQREETDWMECLIIGKEVNVDHRDYQTSRSTIIFTTYIIEIVGFKN